MIAYFSGDPNSSIWARLHTTEQGRIDIGTSEIELNGSGIADFSKIKFPPIRVDELATPEYQVLINVVSGRRSDKLNLLSCETAGGKISALRQKVFDVHCKLIGE